MEWEREVEWKRERERKRDIERVSPTLPILFHNGRTLFGGMASRVTPSREDRSNWQRLDQLDHIKCIVGVVVRYTSALYIALFIAIYEPLTFQLLTCLFHSFPLCSMSLCKVKVSHREHRQVHTIRLLPSSPYGLSSETVRRSICLHPEQRAFSYS